MYSNVALGRLDPAQRPELDALLDLHGERWVIVGPCLDGGWYAWPRGDATAPRIQAPSLAHLAAGLTEAGP
jgi:hypothetical protein